MDNVTLYGHRDSGHACKVALALALAEVDHTRVTVDIWADPATRPAAFLAGSPFAEVPLLTFGPAGHRAALIQSGSILHEIATRTGRLGGDDLARMTRIREVLLWEANRPGMALPWLIEARRAGTDPLNLTPVDWLRDRWAKDCARFDRLIGDAPFLAGTCPTIADCAVWGYAQWTDRAGVTPSDAMARWADRMRALPQMRTPAEFFP